MGGCLSLSFEAVPDTIKDCTQFQRPEIWRSPMSRKCQLTGKKANNAFAISHSHRRTKKLQEVNLQWKRFGGPKAIAGLGCGFLLRRLKP